MKYKKAWKYKLNVNYSSRQNYDTLKNWIIYFWNFSLGENHRDIGFRILGIEISLFFMKKYNRKV